MLVRIDLKRSISSRAGETTAGTGWRASTILVSTRHGRSRRSRGRKPKLIRISTRNRFLTITTAKGRAIVGGRVYRGKRLPELHGAYLYADFFSGNVWALRHDGETVQQDMKLCNSHQQVAGFGEDSTGEVYLCAFDGHIYRIKKIPQETDERKRFPARLSKTGLFTSTDSMTPAPRRDSVFGQRPAVVRQCRQRTIPRVASQWSGGIFETPASGNFRTGPSW